MRRCSGLSRRGTPVVALLALLACPTLARAEDDYHDKDFSLRLASAFIRFTEVSANGGQTVANRWSSAINPASVAWTPLPGKFGFVVAPYYSYLSFNNDTRLHVTGESVTWDTRGWGTIQPTLSQIRGNREVTRQGLIFDYSVDIAQVQWGQRFGDWAIGVNLNYARASVIYDMNTMFGKLRVSDSDADSYRLRLGALYQPAEKWLTGLVVEYGAAPYDAKVIAMGPQGPVMGPNGPVMVKLDGTQQQMIVRPGVSYEYAPYSTVYLDYQLGHYFSSRGTLNHHLFTAGVDHRLLEPLFVRAGAALDARGNLAGTCGLGVFVSRWCSFDLGYHYNPLPELRPEFGRSNVFQFTCNARF